MRGEMKWGRRRDLRRWWEREKAGNRCEGSEKRDWREVTVKNIIILYTTRSCYRVKKKIHTKKRKENGE